MEISEEKSFYWKYPPDWLPFSRIGLTFWSEGSKRTYEV